MIWNIVDNRERKYRWKRVNVVIEATWHDNTCADTDMAPQMEGEGVSYEELPAISLREAISWAQSFPYAVTLYIYDEGRGIAQNISWAEFRRRVMKMREEQAQAGEASGRDPQGLDAKHEHAVAREGDAHGKDVG